MRYLEYPEDHELTLPAHGAFRPSVHVLDAKSQNAVNTALAANRPLLLRGEPGTGKSQLARAAAVGLDRALLSFTVDARTEARDLLYSVDTVARLAEAQILGHRHAGAGFDARAELAESNFTAPGPLWWAFDWEGAERQTQRARLPSPARAWAPEGWLPEHGVVVLVDEIDKADPAVPNGLLEALGLGTFSAPGGVTVTAPPGAPDPLVMITTNEERALPDAFVRRCLVHQLGWPKDREGLIIKLVARGRAHFKELGEDELRRVAEMLAGDRAAVLERGLAPPGGAEYLDLLRALWVRWPADPAQRKEALEALRGFALDKHPPEPFG